MLHLAYRQSLPLRDAFQTAFIYVVSKVVPRYSFHGHFTRTSGTHLIFLTSVLRRGKCDASGTWASCPTGGLTSTTTHSPPHISVPRYITLCMSAQALVSPLYKPAQHLYLVLIHSLLILVSLFCVLDLLLFSGYEPSFVNLHNDTAIRVHCTRAAAHCLPARLFTEDIGQVSHLVPCPKSSTSSKSASSTL